MASGAISFRTILLLALVALALNFAVAWARQIRRSTAGQRPALYHIFVGFLTNFFDTLGIGSFAPTTALLRVGGNVADEKLPGTLNVGHCLPTVLQAVIFIKIVEVDAATLVTLIAAAMAGAWLGAGVVARLPRRRIQLGMGLGLLCSAGFMLAGLTGTLPTGGESLALSGAKLIAALLAHLLFGALMTVGVGAYAPMLSTISLLGMNPRTAFPIMMGSCAFLTCLANLRFLRTKAFDSQAALGLTLGGLPAVAIAVLIVAELPLSLLRVAVVVLAVATSASLIASSRRGGEEPSGFADRPAAVTCPPLDSLPKR